MTGVGGTGVITVGALIGMAAHLERRGVSVLDFTGFAQKFGPVLSYIRLAASPEALHQVRIDQGAADALIGCDVVVSSSPKASGTYRRGTRAVVNTAEMPTGDVVRFRDADLASPARLRAISRVIGDGNLDKHQRERTRRAPARRRRLCQHHHARLCLAARPGADLAASAAARDRAQRRRGRAQQAGVCLGPDRRRCSGLPADIGRRARHERRSTSSSTGAPNFSPPIRMPPTRRAIGQPSQRSATRRPR